MEDLVKIENNEVVVSSRQIAKNFSKRHDHVMRDIENIIGLPKGYRQRTALFRE